MRLKRRDLSRNPQLWRSSDGAKRETGCALLGTGCAGGGVGGAILGAIFVTVLANGMDLMRLGSNHQMIILGFVLVIAVLLDRERTKLGYVSTAADVRKVVTRGVQTSDPSSAGINR
jgi:hypothetical protein